MLTAPQLLGYYPDLQDERTKTALALVHSRFSTNTFPSWELAHPYRMIAHNGEINTLRGNVNWMRARESQLASELFGDDLPKVLPVVRPGGSDSATFDNVLELLTLAGRSLPHAVMMMIPEAYEDRDDLPEHLRGFYAFHSCLMEPWDGPAAVAFTDGRVIGATLDRNGLRPGRWLETKDGWVVLGSETGVIDEPPENVLRKGRLQPGKLFLVDLERGPDRRRRGGQARGRARSSPTASGSSRASSTSPTCPSASRAHARAEPLRARQLAFGYTQEDLRCCSRRPPRAARSRSARWATTSRSRCSPTSQPPLFSYFKQLFAQVTNPPIDPIREAIVMSVVDRRRLRAQPARRDARARAPARDGARRSCATPSSRGCARSTPRSSSAHTIDITWPVAEGAGRAWSAALERICAEADEVARGRRQHPDPVRPRASAPSAWRSRRCWPSAASTTTSCARARACRPASCSSPASRARSTTSRR